MRSKRLSQAALLAIALSASSVASVISGVKSGWQRTAAAQTESQLCNATPAQTEGPYYLPLNLPRKDITENKPGVPLTLRMEIVDARTCRPVAGKAVDLWHADANGVYSGIARDGTTGQTFLRGSQVTDSQGVVEFQTVYPGWYPGRTTHIHFKVHLDNGQELASQLYFNDSLNDQVYRLPPYDARTGSRVTNAQDGILRGTPNADQTLFPQASLSNGAVNASIRIGVSQ